MNLNAEVICDFKVSTLRKKVWQAQLDMVKIFIDICVPNKLLTPIIKINGENI